MPLAILLLADNPLDADLIEATLLGGEIDCELQRVATRSAFVKALKPDRFDLILADYALPGLDGAAALEIARERCPDLPFIFVSGRLGEEFAIEAIKQGATDYVLKQRLERLIPCVQRALREAQDRSEKKSLEAKRQQTEIAIRESEERFRKAEADLREAHQRTITIWESMTDAYAFLDQEWRVVYANATSIQTICHLTGLEPDAILGKSHWELFSWAIGQPLEREYRRAMAEQVPIHLEIFYEPTGNWFEIHGYPSAIGLGVYYRDISDRKLAEARLSESEEKYRSLFNEMSEGFCSVEVLYDEDGQPIDHRFLQANPAFERHTNLSGASGSLASELMPGLEQVWNDLYARIIATGESERIEQYSSAFDRWFEVEASRVGDASRCRVAVVFRDITDRKRTEEILRRTAELDAFRVSLTDALRPLTDTSDILAIAARILGESLGVTRVIYFEVVSEGEEAIIHRNYTNGVAELSGKYRFEDYRRNLTVDHQAGQTQIVTNIPDNPKYTDAEKGNYLDLEIAAHIDVPLLKNNQFVAVLAVHQSTPRQWTETEVKRVEETAERTWAAVERARAEAALRQNEEQTRNILESIHEAFFALDENWQFTYLNPSVEALLDRTLDDLVGKNIWEEYPGLIGSEFEHIYRGAMHDRVAGSLTQFYPDHDRWYEVRTYPAPNGISVYFRNVTEQIAAAAVLRESEERYRTLFESIDEGFCTIEVLFDQNDTAIDYRYLEVNPKFEQQTGLKQVVGKRVLELVPDHEQSWFEIYGRIVMTGKSLRFENEARTLNRWYDVYAFRVGQPEQRQVGVLFRDITEKKQLEAQFYRAQRLESLGTLASGIAHDLNNVLTPVLAISQLLRLQHTNLDARSQNLLKILEDSARRGTDMIKQILTFTRGTGEERNPLQVISLVQEVCNIVEQSFPRTIRICQTIPEQALGLVSANSTHLHQVLMNLCINSRDAMPEGGVLSVSVEACVVDQAFAQAHLDVKIGDYVVITIADTGTGIPLEVRDRIFDPFFTTKPQGKGTGLGLATAMGIIKEYGGFLQVVSEVDRGTQMKVYLPTIEEISAPSQQLSQQLKGNGELILIVDDDVAVQCATQALLENHNYTVLSTNDGLDAIALYTQHQNDIRLVILDIMMPTMSGITLIQRLRAINPRVRTIAMSGLPINREPALAAGANAFLAKPCNLEHLLENLQTAISS